MAGLLHPSVYYDVYCVLLSHWPLVSALEKGHLFMGYQPIICGRSLAFNLVTKHP
ncbi:hypothetical protein C0J52_15162 [Blattella germanica]|nr:hypothetical protein C0J52_15162 [Blattella germanica]PSN36310.1 hypothetical protein C0J52_15162 [Blattella germanica]